MQFLILFEIKIPESDDPYCIPLASSLIFFHVACTESQGGIIAVAGTH